MKRVVVIFAVLTVLASALPVQDGWNSRIRRRRGANDCLPLANISQLFASLNANIDTSVYLRPIPTGNTQSTSVLLTSLLPRELNRDQVVRSQTFGNRTCPSSVSGNARDPLWMRSLCPWYYRVIDLPFGHYPRIIPQAVCKCHNCIDNNRNQCERVTTHIRVLEETGCRNGFLTYRPKTILHHVGCACVKRPITFEPIKDWH